MKSEEKAGITLFVIVCLALFFSKSTAQQLFSSFAGLTGLMIIISSITSFLKTNKSMKLYLWFGTLALLLLTLCAAYAGWGIK